VPSSRGTPWYSEQAQSVKHPGQVGLVVADVGEFPVEDRDDLELRTVEDVGQPAVAPTQDQVFGLIDVVAQPLCGRGEFRARLTR